MTDHVLGREHKERLLLALAAGTCQPLPAEKNIPILSNLSEYSENLASRISACNQRIRIPEPFFQAASSLFVLFNES